MANQTKYFKTPFAESGTRAEVPNNSVGGAVGFDTGFGPDYELPQGSAGRKRIERDKYNGLHHSITKNLKQWQEKVYPTWIQDDGTGVAFSYPQGMIVNHAGQDWISNEAGNQEEPGSGNKWSVYFLAKFEQYGTVSTLAAGKHPVGTRVALTDRALGIYLVTVGGAPDGKAILDAGNSNTAVLILDENTNLLTLGGKLDSGATDNAPIINYGIALLGHLKIPSSGLDNFYGIQSPIYVGANQGLIGSTYARAELKKTTNTLGVGSNIKPSGVGSDSYVKDAVLVVTHADNAYATYVQLKNLQIVAGVGNEYTIYAPRMFVSNIKNVTLLSESGKYGFVTHDTFMTSFSDFQIAGNNSMQADSIGAWWDDEADGGSGTSCLFDRMWVRDGWHSSYKMRGLVYSTFNACGTDKYIDRALDLDLCDINFNGFGFEDRTLAGVTPILVAFSRVSLNNAVGFSVAIANGQYVVDCNGSVLNINGIRHTTEDASGGTVLVRNGGRVNESGAAYSENLTTQTPTLTTGGTHLNLDLITNQVSGVWTPVVAGSTVAGVYELSVATCTYTKSGKTVTLHANISVAGSITGGGTGNLRIAGLPFVKPNNGVLPAGSCMLGGIGYTPGSLVTVSFDTGGSTSTLRFAESTPGSSIANIPISALGTNDSIQFTITYETNV